MNPPVEKVEGYLPYLAAGSEEGLVVRVHDLSRLTILLGPNAAGKTSVLTVLGYTIATLEGNPGRLARLLAILSPLRLDRAPPRILVGAVDGEGRPGRTAVITELDVPAQTLEHLRDAWRLLHGGGEGEAPAEKQLQELAESLDKVYGIVDTRRGVLKSLMTASAITRLLGYNYRLSRAPYLAQQTGRERNRARVFLAHILENSSAKLHAVAAYTKDEIIAAAKPSGTEAGVEVTVYNPGYAYTPGLLETLYFSTKGHEAELPRENEAVEALRSFINWADGFEVTGDRLYLRSRQGGRRVDIYTLSDGQRAATILAALYASTGTRNTAMLIDTPEAFAHPDGLEVMAKMIARLATHTGQVIVATQSLELLEELLHSAKEEGILDETSIIHLNLHGHETSPTGAWDGATILNLIEEVDLDPRLITPA